MARDANAMGLRTELCVAQSLRELGLVVVKSARGPFDFVVSVGEDSYGLDLKLHHEGQRTDSWTNLEDLNAQISDLVDHPDDSSLQRRVAIALGSSAISVITGAALSAVYPPIAAPTLLMLLELMLFGAVEAVLVDATLSRLVSAVGEFARRSHDE
jgi:hypothetical protein